MVMAIRKDQDDKTQPDAPALEDTGVPLTASTAPEHRSSRPPLLGAPAVPRKVRRSWFGARKESSDDVQVLTDALVELDQQVTALEQSGLDRADRIDSLETALSAGDPGGGGDRIKSLEARVRALETRRSPSVQPKGRLGTGASLRGGAPASVAPGAGPGADRIRQLERTLKEEQQRRRDLELRLGRLQLLVERLESGSEGPSAGTPPSAGLPSGTSRDGINQEIKGIRGLGPAFAAKLEKAGVGNATDVAGWTESDVVRFAKLLGISPARIHRELWVEQAQELISA